MTAKAGAAADAAALVEGLGAAPGLGVALADRDRQVAASVDHDRVVAALVDRDRVVVGSADRDPAVAGLGDRGPVGDWVDLVAGDLDPVAARPPRVRGPV